VNDVTRAENCVVAVADCFLGDGEIVANPIGVIPMIGGRLARASGNPDLVMTDGEATFVANDEAFVAPEVRVIESYNPYRSMFDVVWSGRRHVVMGASQIDRYGNQNLAAIGSDYSHPKSQLIGFRGAPGNTVNHTTSYWIPNHSPKVFVETVDVVTGIGWDRAQLCSAQVRDNFEIRRVVSNLGVFDFESPGHTMRLRSIHPGVTVNEIVSATGFDLCIPEHVPQSRQPSEEELWLIRSVIDPEGRRNEELVS
jgi:acyl CoA:acetate/3-ketoacid CoA transferase beta subunit